MSLKKVRLLITAVFIISSCAPKVSTVISKNYAPLDYREEVRVFGLEDAFPGNAEDLGEIKIGDTGFSTNCGWELVLERAKYEARKIGGNAIKITRHIPPSAFGSSCHRINARILKVENLSIAEFLAETDSSMIGADYALLHVYRPGGMGALINYDLYLEDSVICRVSNNWKKTIQIKNDGYKTLWARTEIIDEISVNIEFGKHYYLRCGITMGAFVGHPSLELINVQTGKIEYQAVGKSR